MTQQERIEQAAEEAANTALFISSQWIPTGIELFKQGANFALQNQWISVDEELPKQENERQFFSKDILFRENSSVYFGWYDFEEKYFRNSIGCTFTRVTHWMPIPTLEGGEE